MKYNKLKLEEPINFNWISKKYGRTLFSICPKFQKGYLKGFYLSFNIPDEDRLISYYFKPDFKINIFQITDFTENQSIHHWLNVWCNEHKALCQKVYAPKNSKYFTISIHFGDTISLNFYD